MTSVHGPGEPDDRDESGDPQSVDAAFDEIVANIDKPSTSASTTPWPDAEDDEGPLAAPPSAEVVRTPRPDWPGWDDVRVPDESADDEDDDEFGESDEEEGHYEPPPPPPVPRGDSVTRGAWAGALGAPLLAILMPLLGWGMDGLVGLLLVGAFLAGFVTLISRLRTGPRIDDGPDDGAVV